ncbi:MAG: hypothetical protein L0214_12170 [candidate division NC10 bacterium]|nr:hypothetical protein [candidate division NC10 bacterium]
MMGYAAMQLAGLGIFLALTFGPLVALLVLLNVRDRRQSLLLAAVLRQVAFPDYRGRVAAEVRCAMFSRRSVVRFYMLAWSRDEIWDAIARLSRVLSPHVRLVVEGRLDREFPARFTVETTGRHQPCRPCRSSVATG